MARFKKYPQKNQEGKLVYKKGIIDGIVILAVNEIPEIELYSYTPGKNKTSSIRVEYDKSGVIVEVDIVVPHSQCISDMSFKVQEAIRHNIETMTEYHVLSVNVVVRGVVFDEQNNQQEVK